ncbi:MAG TPA: hypothetical protein VK760_09025 [Candidatus Acidoferrales bacterium]|nr:hypothetical protein [Candidatus Acidoferrales bacterium]
MHRHPERRCEAPKSKDRYKSFALIAAFSILAACAPHVPFALSKDDQSRFGADVVRVNVPGHDPMIFGMNDCIVYKAKTAHDDIVGWDVVLASDWGQHSYPKWMTGCTSQSIKYDGKYVVVDMCAQALGAGGGCAGGGGTYRSRKGDAVGWQVTDGKRWFPLPK